MAKGTKKPKQAKKDINVKEDVNKRLYLELEKELFGLKKYVEGCQK